MDMRRARAIAEQMIKSGQNKGKSLEDLVREMVAGGQAAPDTAIGNALVVVPPRTVTPATPAPMQPGVPFVAPKPTAEMMPQTQEQELPVAPQRAAPRRSRYRQMLESTLSDLGAAEEAMAQAASAGQKPDIMAQIRLETLRRQAQNLQGLALAEEGPEGEIPEELRAALEGRKERLARREEVLAEEKARSPWEALLAGGAAMAQGRRGERFTEALARGLQTGIMDYNRARRANIEGIEDIAEARDQAEIDRYTMQERAREAALARARDVLGMEEKSRDRAVAEVRLPLQMRGDEAQTALAEFKAKNAPAEAAAEQALRYAQAAYYSDGRGRGRGGSDVEGRADRRELDTAAARYRGAAARYEALRKANPGATMEVLRQNDAKTVDDYLEARAELEGYSSAFERTYGRTPYIGGRNPSVGPLSGERKPPVPGARLAPDGNYYVPDPKRPGKYLQVS